MYLSAMTTTSSAAFPARSPRPPTVTLTQVAPPWMPATALATAMPKSLCVCISTSRPVCSTSSLTTLYVVSGSMMPMVSQKRSRSAPSALAAAAYSSRKPSSVRLASSALTET